MKAELVITDDNGNTKRLIVDPNVFVNAEQFALNEFKNIGDDGLFPNHTDKDIWLSGFKYAIECVLLNSTIL